MSLRLAIAGAVVGGAATVGGTAMAGPDTMDNGRITAIFREAAVSAGCGDREQMARDLAAIQSKESPSALLDGDRAVNEDGTPIRGDLDLGLSRGPFQFNDAAGTWATYGNGGDPDRLDDSAEATARMLCANGYAADRRTAVRKHNGSGAAAEAYANDVVGRADTVQLAGANSAGPVNRDGLFLRTMDIAFGWAIDGVRRIAGHKDTPPELSRLVRGSTPTTTTRSDGLEPSFGANLERLITAADARFGPGVMVVYSGRRTAAEQLALWDESDRSGTWVAWSDGQSCTSEHCRGAAADLAFASPAIEQWTHSNASTYGLQFRMSWEPWHISNKENQ